MNPRSQLVALGLFLALPVWAQSAAAQQPAGTQGDLQKQVDALRGQVQAMQKDLDEIKALLAPLRARQPSPPANLTLDLGDRPMKGAATASLVLVELTDYQ